MIGASFLSVGFLLYGAFYRVWSVAAVGQIFLALALYHFFFPPNADHFPWTWVAAAVPIVVVFATGRAALEWLRHFTEIPESWRAPMRLLACVYLLVAIAGLVRWVFGEIPDPQHQLAALLFLGTLIFSMSLRCLSTFGVRCSFIPTLIGMGLYLDNFATQAHDMATCLNGLAMLLFLAQPALLR